jgi:outer membrane protein OmpA-like peptidoglycan-associated protein
MVMRTIYGLVIAAALALPTAAGAQTDFTAEDIVNHFNPAEGAGPKTRAVTFGATGFGESDGAKPEGAAEPAAAEPAAFNLSITFDLNSDRLTGRAQRNLLEFAEALKRPELQALRFAVDGHTDASGTESYNQGLSERRAMAVVRFLTAQGIDASRLIARGHGESQPVNPNAAHPDNRRVETRLIQ